MLSDNKLNNSPFSVQIHEYIILSLGLPSGFKRKVNGSRIIILYGAENLIIIGWKLTGLAVLIFFFNWTRLSVTNKLNLENNVDLESKTSKFNFKFCVQRNLHRLFCPSVYSMPIIMRHSIHIIHIEREYLCNTDKNLAIVSLFSTSTTKARLRVLPLYSEHCPRRMNIDRVTNSDKS